MLAAFNLQTAFKAYDFYKPNVTPWIIGIVLALVTAYCILGEEKELFNLLQLWYQLWELYIY